MKYYEFSLIYTGNSYQHTDFVEISEREFNKRKSNKKTQYDSEEKAYRTYSDKHGTHYSFVCEREK